MNYEEMRATLNNFRQTQRVADQFATELAMLLEGRLQHITSHETLRKLKDELRLFNTHTGRWRKPR